jgi:hypothetical protein
MRGKPSKSSEVLGGVHDFSVQRYEWRKFYFNSKLEKYLSVFESFQ